MRMKYKEWPNVRVAMVTNLLMGFLFLDAIFGTDIFILRFQNSFDINSLASYKYNYTKNDDIFIV